MSEIQSYAAAAIDRVPEYVRSSGEQALVYAVEEVVAEVFPWALLNKEELKRFIVRLSESEGIDPPLIVHQRLQGSVVATAYRDHRAISVRGTEIAVGVALHEMAHLTCGSKLHGVVFRNELIRLVRRYGDVEHAAMLYQVFSAVGLEMGPWMASR